MQFRVTKCNAKDILLDLVPTGLGHVYSPLTFRPQDYNDHYQIPVYKIIPILHQCGSKTILSIWWRHQNGVLVQSSKSYTRPKILYQHFCLRLFGLSSPSSPERGPTELPCKTIKNGVGWYVSKNFVFEVELRHLNWAQKGSHATKQKEIWDR